MSKTVFSVTLAACVVLALVLSGPLGAAPKGKAVKVRGVPTLVKKGQAVPVKTTPQRKLSPPVTPKDTTPYQVDPRRLPVRPFNHNAVQPLPTRSDNYYHVNRRRVQRDQAGFRRFNTNRNILIRRRGFRNRR